MESENQGLEDDFPFQTGDCQVPAVDFPGYNPNPVRFFLRRLQNFLAEIGRNPQRLVPWFPNVQRGEDFNLFLFDNVLLESVLAD